MFSKKDFQPLIWLYRIGAWAHIVPYFWDESRNRLVCLSNFPGKRRNYRIWKSIAILNISCHLGYMIGIGSLLAFEPNIVASEVIIGILFISSCLTTLPLHVMLLSHGHLLVRHVNSLQFLNLTSGMKHDNIELGYCNNS